MFSLIALAKMDGTSASPPFTLLYSEFQVQVKKMFRILASSVYIFLILCVTLWNTENIFSILDSGAENDQNSLKKIGGWDLWLFNFLLEVDEAFEAFLVELLKAPGPII